MTPETYRRLLRELNLSQNEVGIWLSGSGDTGRRWAKEGPPVSVGMLLAIMREMGLSRGDVSEIEERASDA